MTRDGRRLGARVVATDEAHDLALLRTDAPHGLVPLALAPEPAARGQAVVAIGNPYDVDQDADADDWRRVRRWSLTRGVVSGVAPLLDCHGRVAVSPRTCRRPTRASASGSV